jgi:large conductance mechanosensitive channel
MFEGFKKFILRGNVLDLAVGVVIGAAFNDVISALVKDFLTPLIGIAGRIPDFTHLQFTVNGSRFMYGHFLNSLLSFLLIAATIYFFVVNPINKLVEKTKREEAAEPTTKKCTECLSEIPIQAKRCAHCAMAQV